MFSIVLCFFLALLQGSAKAGIPESVSLLEQGKYLEARDKIRSELALEESGTGYLNLGFAENKLGETTEAYAHFLKASELLPRSSELASFLKQSSQNQSWKKFETKALLPRVFFLNYFLNEYEVWLLVALFMLTSSLIFGILIYYQKPLQVFYLALFLSLYVLGSAVSKTNHSGTWLVTRKDSQLNVTPSASPQSMESLPKHSVLRLEREANGWAYAEISSGKKGWIHESDFVKVD
ncbi:MAG: hypothetical protein WCI18_16465 [Pseudomonadota bacterium]